MKTAFSLRTMMLATSGLGILCGLFTTAGWEANAAHLLLVLAVAIPAGSLAYDIRRSHRSLIVGTCVGAVLGTIAISTIVLIADFWRIMA